MIWFFFFFSLDMNINRNYTKLRCYMIIGDNVQHPESGSLGCIKFFSWKSVFKYAKYKND